MLQIPQKDGTFSPLLFKRRDMQQIASAMISDPKNAAALVQVYGAMAAGITEPLVGLLGYFHTPNQPIAYGAMSTLMDIASGTGASRRAEIAEQAETALLGPYLNQPVELEDVDPSLVLGDAFRTAPVSDVPVLLLSGTLDGRTYLLSQREAVAGLRNAQIVTVVNAGHNLFMSSPEVTTTIKRFMGDDPLLSEEILIDLPAFAEVPAIGG